MPNSSHGVPVSGATAAPPPVPYPGSYEASPPYDPHHPPQYTAHPPCATPQTPGCSTKGGRGFFLGTVTEARYREL
ncbi:hypothetical protein T484DRAFT_1937390 [Baffinella frigidus]|nr:hypothetical protein T484DRAFT_1937390 [Cryptophyta sp. CCMP2293]